MNRQEALSFLDKCRWWFEPYTGDPKKWHEAVNMAIEALQFQDIMINNPKTAKPTPEVCKNCKDNKQDDWIPVGETSFLQAGEYLATAVCDNGATFTDKFGYTPTTDGGWYDPETPNQTYVDWNKHVIAWRPLPEPYNGDTRGEE